MAGPRCLNSFRCGCVVEHDELVEIRIREEAPVDTGTWATLAAQGITGVSVINGAITSQDFQLEEAYFFDDIESGKLDGVGIVAVGLLFVEQRPGAGVAAHPC